MIVDKKKFYTGLGMIVVFSVLLVCMFLPILDGQNLLASMDELYNSISKGSANYIHDVLEESEKLKGVDIEAGVEMNSEEEAEQTALLYTAGSAQVEVSGAHLEISGDLGHILINAVQDAEALYNNDADGLARKYGYDGRRVIYNWQQSLVRLHEELEGQRLMEESKTVAEVNERAVEPAYNYFGIEPEIMADKVGVVVGSLFFYIFYTVLYGFGIMFLFDGWGLKTRGH